MTTFASSWVVGFGNGKPLIYPQTTETSAMALANALNALNDKYFYVILYDADVLADLCDRHGLDVDKFMVIV